MMTRPNALRLSAYSCAAAFTPPTSASAHSGPARGPDWFVNVNAHEHGGPLHPLGEPRRLGERPAPHLHGRSVWVPTGKVRVGRWVGCQWSQPKSMRTALHRLLVGECRLTRGANRGRALTER
jgi:hypothetical protein